MKSPRGLSESKAKKHSAAIQWYSVVKKTLTKTIQNYEQRHLEQDPEHRDHRTYRHRHHLRSDLLHERVNKKITTLPDRESW